MNTKSRSNFDIKTDIKTDAELRAHDEADNDMYDISELDPSDKRITFIPKSSQGECGQVMLMRFVKLRK